MSGCVQLSYQSTAIIFDPYLFILKKVLLLALFTLAGIVPLLAQERCGTVEYEQKRRLSNPNLETTDQFENWMRIKIAQLKTQNAARTQSITYTIPVVVHIIYNTKDSTSAARGNAVGTFISDTQVQSQIDRINIDYPRLNADTTNTPAEFQSVAGGIKINFVLAKQNRRDYPRPASPEPKGQRPSGHSTTATYSKP